MNKLTSTLLTLGLVLASSTAYSDQIGPAKPEVIAQSHLTGMPTQ